MFMFGPGVHPYFHKYKNKKANENAFLTIMTERASYQRNSWRKMNKIK